MAICNGNQSIKNDFSPESKLSQYLNDPTTSTWLKQALESQHSRDPVDAINDTLELYDFLQKKFDWMLKQEPSETPLIPVVTS